MTMTDPIADMLTRIRNANTAMRDEVKIPYSKMKVALADVLQQEGYIKSFGVTQDDSGPGQTLKIDMKYSKQRERVISGITRVSKPGLRVYSKSDKIPRVLGGLGVAIVSTSKGLMSDREARRRRIGGEVVCVVW
ncbi:MAG: 30S ribosomal protein S8 [Acidimicrobiia bacterium]|nr:30S ribosomal protein S8 [Acidimicrobiia bacterium]MYC58319.1 30S ribosomal protein S8 [Acidimicrobiia bacterium]MYG93494.1 30S ribosomal protein S8 [Acidimicrobiia bacterium]MYI29974.1 30S ribosomal protein S8 [Acidimicrobiia bacterium]